MREFIGLQMIDAADHHSMRFPTALHAPFLELQGSPTERRWRLFFRRTQKTLYQH
jgi:hypothetical protein